MGNDLNEHNNLQHNSGNDRQNGSSPETASPVADRTDTLLSHIDSPADLRKLSVSQLPRVCSEIRDLMIDELSRNPGHFASSMGAVELTVALHYTLDTPYDRIVWDVGHQAYAHKLLTGRRDKFCTNRKEGGLSGFPSPEESEYDTFTAGHASNSISAALGMAVATQLKDEHPRRNVVAVIGDASIGGGLAFEGLNNAANMPNDLLIILNDNNMSIDRNVGSLHSYLTHINTTKTYNSIRYKVYNFLKGIGLISDKRRGFILRFNNAMKAVLSQEQNIFEGLNIRYFGPFDGHDVAKIVRILNETKKMKGPKILHLRTVKGKGYAPAEKDPANWHAPGKFDRVTGNRLSSTTDNKPLKFQDVFGKTLLELAEKDPTVVAVTAAMPSGTSVGIMQEKIPERTFDVGISEGHAVTFAGGLAKDGLLPVVAIYSSFLQRAYDHIIHDVSIAGWPVIFAIDRAGLVGEDGVTHHGAFDMAYLRTVPGMTIAAPRNEHWLRNILYTAVKRRKGPFALRYPRGAGSITDWHNEMKEVTVGKGEKITAPEGARAVIISAGTIAANVSKAVAALSDEGIPVAHYDAVFVKPLDEELLREAADAEIPIVTVEDGTVEGGFGSAVAEWLAANDINRPLKIIGIPDRFIKHGTVPQLQKKCGLDPDSIRDSVRDIIERHKPNRQS